MGGSLDVGVAIHARKHAAVHRVLEFNGIDVQTHRLAVDVMGKAGVAVAGEAVFVRGLLSSSGAGDTQQDQDRATKPRPRRASLHSGSLTFGKLTDIGDDVLDLRGA